MRRWVMVGRPLHKQRLFVIEDLDYSNARLRRRKFSCSKLPTRRLIGLRSNHLVFIVSAMCYIQRKSEFTAGKVGHNGDHGVVNMKTLEHVIPVLHYVCYHSIVVDRFLKPLVLIRIFLRRQYKCL